MKYFKLAKIILNITDKFKPFLIKLLPVTFLRRIKKGMVNSSMDIFSKTEEFLPFSRSAYPDGINLIGFIRGEIGLGHSCRLVAAELETAGIDFAIYNYEQAATMRYNDHSWDRKITNATPYNINIVHINPQELPLAFLHIDRKTWDKRYNIAFWLWELENFPAEWKNALKLVDEVWTPSEFSSESIRKATDKPVRTIPYALATPDCGGLSREHFHLPDDKFLFLCMYDCNSTIERKNPLGTISAYRLAFSPDDQDVGLVIKINNPQKDDIRIIQKELTGYGGIYIISDVLEKTQVNALIACADVYISLHRSEGFGLVPAEAMFLGTPVIATNWSSNTEFMNNDVACMVDYRFVTIEKDAGPYLAGNRWADPDIRQAAGFMRTLFEGREYGQDLARKARTFIEDKLSPERAAALIRNRISNIYKNIT